MKKTTTIMIGLVLSVLFASCGTDCTNCVTQEQLKLALDSVKQTAVIAPAPAPRQEAYSANTTETSDDGLLIGNDKDAACEVDPDMAARYLDAIDHYHNEISRLPFEKRWKNEETVGTTMNTIGNTAYEFFVSPKDKYGKAEFWFRQTAIAKADAKGQIAEEGFPRKRISFVYSYKTNKGYLVLRTYKTDGQGEAINDPAAAKKAFEDMLTLAPKIMKAG